MKKSILLLLLIFGLSGCSGSDLYSWKADQLARISEKTAQAAINFYRVALKLSASESTSDSLRLKLGNMYLKTGAYAQAIEQLRSIKAPQAQALLAKALLKNADYAGALEVFNKTGEKGSDEYIFDYAYAAEKSNLYDQALRLYALINRDSKVQEKALERIRLISLSSGKDSFAGLSDDVKKRIAESPGQKEYPDASGIYLLVDESIQLTPDNRQVEEMHYVIKILNDRGREKFGEVSLAYDSTYEKLELEYARTVKPDGTVVTVGDKNIRDVSLYLNYPLYSNARARIISMPEVVPGATIEYKAKLTRNKLPNKKDFDTAYWLQIDEPIVLERSRIRIPKDRDLKYKIINGSYNTFGFDMAPKISEDRGEKVYTVEFKNVPQIIPEPGMPPVSRINPYILFSTFESWQDIYTWWRGLYKDKIVADEDIKQKALALSKEKKSLEDKIRSIYNFCVQEIRYVAVEYGDAGYEPHKASEIYKNKYGDCKDKAILLVSMLNSAGIDAYPVLISTYGSLDTQEDLPSLSFNHAIAAVEVDGKIIFMDATASTVPLRDLPINDQDRFTVVFFKDKYGLIRTPIFEPDHNKILTKMNVVMDNKEQVEVERSVFADGFYQQAQRYWLKYSIPALIEEELKHKARAIISSAVLKGYTIKNVEDLDSPVVLTYKFSAPQYLKKAGNTRILEQLGGLDVSGIAKESRKYPIEISALDAREDMIEVELPGHLAVKYLPKPVEVETKWFDFINRYEITEKKGLRFHSMSRIKERQIPVAEYAAYKKALEAASMLADQQVVIEERPH